MQDYTPSSQIPDFDPDEYDDYLQENEWHDYDSSPPPTDSGDENDIWSKKKGIKNKRKRKMGRGRNRRSKPVVQYMGMDSDEL